MGEEWRDIECFEGLYQVSDLGRVKSFHGKTPRILKQATTPNGYRIVCLMKDGIKTMVTIHRLVAEAFIPNMDNKPDINHMNGNKTDNRVSNLEWATRAENVLHAYETGLRNPPNQKAVECSNGVIYESQSEAARDLGLSTVSVSKVCRGIFKQAGGYTFKYAEEDSMAVKGFTCYLTYYQISQLVPEETRGKFWEAVMEYMFNDHDMEDELDTITRMALINVKSHLKTSKRRSDAGKSGMESRWDSNSITIGDNTDITKSPKNKSKVKVKLNNQGESDSNEEQPFGFGIPAYAKAALEERGLLNAE